MKRWTARVASPDVYTLAEGPLWDGPRDRLLWVDIEAGAVHIGTLDGDRVVRTDTRPVDRTAAAVVSGRTGEGNLWIACYGAGEVRRYAPDGTLTGVVEVGAPNVTCPAFVGPGFDRLLITTARSDGDRDSGRLFLAASVPSACP